MRAASSSTTPIPIPVAEGYRPYAWTPPPAEVARRHGIPPEHILRYDQNTPPLPGIPQLPLAESFASVQDYPSGEYRGLREAAAGYVGHGVEWSQVVVGSGADDLILLVARCFLGLGRRSSIVEPTYSMYRVASQLADAEVTEERTGASVIWLCNPANPSGEVTSTVELAAIAQAHPDAVVVVDEAYIEFGGGSMVPLLPEHPNVVVVRTLSKAFGFASLRVGYAVASPALAAILEARRAPAPIATIAARIGAAALREPRFDLGPLAAERERVRAALADAGYDAPPTATNFVVIRLDDPEAKVAELEAQGLIVRGFRGGIRVTLRTPADDDVLLRALGADPGESGAGRSATTIRTTTETALRISLSLDGQGRARVATGIGFLDHLLALFAFHGGLDLELLAGGDIQVDEHHTTEDVLAALGSTVARALGDRAGIARYGAATIPMDEAQATAAVDLVRRPHAEIALSFTGERVGGLAVSLLKHALERFAIEAGCTVHVSSAGADDHHVAEAAFKALGRALREAIAPGGEGIRSTKGAA